MKLKRKHIQGRPIKVLTLSGGTLLVAATGLPGLADSADARCDIYSTGEDRVQRSVPCVFSQRQGHISIRSDDGTRYELTPKGDAPGNYSNQQGKTVYRQSGLGSAGLIFKLPGERLYVHWQTPPIGDQAPESQPAPVVTEDTDPTTE